MNRFEYEATGGCLKVFFWLAVLGSPFLLWQQGHVWGQVAGILAGIVIYPTVLTLFIARLKR